MMSQVASNISNSTAYGDNSNAASRVESPLKQIKFYLDKYKIKDALQIFFSESTLRLLAEEPEFMWDVIPLICTRLRGLCQYRFRVFEGCERMLCRLAEDEHRNSKEVLISLLAEINHTEHREDDNVFRAVIRPLEGALLRMNLPSPREENFRWTLNVLMRHINDTPLPQEYNIEGRKRLSLPNDPSVKRFIETLPLMLSFIEELNEKPLTLDYDKSPMPILTESQIDEVLNGELNSVDYGNQDDDLEEEDENENENDNDNEEDKDEDEDSDDEDDFMSDVYAPARSDITDASITALLRLIQRPFTTLDSTNYCKELRSTSVRCLCLLLRLMPDLMAPIYKQASKNLHSSEEDPLSPSKLSINPNAPDQAHISPLEVAPDMVSSHITPLANQHFDGDVSSAMLTLATCAYLFRCEVKTYPSPRLSPTSSTAYISNLVSPAMPTTPLAIEMTQYFPQILTHDSLFYCHVPYIVVLLKRPEILAHEKGLGLLGNLLALLSINSQGQKLLEVCRSSSLISQLFHIMIHSPLSTNRRNAYDLFTVICDVLTYDCKFDLFKWSLQRSDLRPCIRAACIDQYRRQLSNTHKILGGRHLTEFLDLCIAACLPEGRHTDIIENNDLILATLTMFRYLRLRKPLVEDDIEIEYLASKKLRKRFFNPVRSALAMLRAELETHLHQSRGDSGDIECSNFVLCRLDLVESILNCATE